jgi:NADPH2:quinone reductase
MLRGMTAHYLSHSAYPIRKGDEILVHAGAGGVGLLLTQMAKTLGARVTATVSTREKASLSLEAGADESSSVHGSGFCGKGSTLLAGG